MTADELKQLFEQPLMLLLIMFAAAGGSVLKQIAVSRRQGTDVGILEYFMKVETLIMVGAVFASFLTLLYSDTLNIASALGFGYVSNDAADAFTKEGRSASITSAPMTPSSKDSP